MKYYGKGMNRREKEKKLEMLRTLVKSPYNYQVPQLMSLVDIGHSTFYDWVKKYGLKKPVSRPMQFNSDWKNLFLLIPRISQVRSHYKQWIIL